MTSVPSGIRAAEPGEMWVLTYRYRTQIDRVVEEVGVYRDPRRAIHDLAQLIRPAWITERTRATDTRSHRPLPAAVPDSDFAAVALFFADPGHDETRVGFRTYDLALHTIEDSDAPPTPNARQEHVLVLPYEEYLCLCGNTATLDGFQPCDTAGTVCPEGPDAEWKGHVLCCGCGRIIAAPTGAVIGQVPPGHPDTSDRPRGTTPDGDSLVDLDALTAKLRERGHDATVEQTGGGVATLLAGPQAPDRNGEARWAAAVGPGWLEGPTQRAVADSAELYVGPDGEDAWSVMAPAHAGPDEVVTLIVAVIDEVQVSRDRFARACQGAWEAMWTAFATHYPELPTGDQSPAAGYGLTAEVTQLCTRWLDDHSTPAAPAHLLAATRGGPLQPGRSAPH